MPEQESLKRGLKGRQEVVDAFNALLLRNKALIWHICSDYSLGRTWKTEDCVQEVVYQLWRSFRQFEGKSSEKTWVYRVAANTMLMIRRKDFNRPITEPINTMSDDSHEPAAVMADDNYQQLLQLIDALPEKDAVVIRSHLDGFTYQEIADMNDMTVGAVAMRISRLKRRLRMLYEQENKTRNN